MHGHSLDSPESYAVWTADRHGRRQGLHITRVRPQPLRRTCNPVYPRTSYRFKPDNLHCSFHGNHQSNLPNSINSNFCV